jgi:geranylgeranyl diphosphate synthase, type I
MEMMSASTAPLPESVRLARDLVAPALRAAVSKLSPGMVRVAGYHHGWLDAAGQPVQAWTGKALRPALALLSTQAAGAAAEAGVPAAVAVELVHNFSLLHDDIMDGDTERRHRPTAWTVFGTSSAILAGDALLTAAMETLLVQPVAGARPAIQCLAAATQRLIAGQTLDLSFEHRSDVLLPEYLAMARDKTSALMNCASCIGAVLVGGEPALIDGLAAFGEHLGTAFQMVDDLLGIWGTPDVTGKPVLSDLRSRKKSLPVVAALCATGPAAGELAELYFRSSPLDEDELRRTAVLVELAGGREWAARIAEDELSSAERCLAGLSLPAQIHEELLGIARFVADRDR